MGNEKMKDFGKEKWKMTVERKEMKKLWVG